jgi:hypothetical protein
MIYHGLSMVGEAFVESQDRDVQIPGEAVVPHESAVLERLIAEVETDELLTAGKYNRTNNRHNR